MIFKVNRQQTYKTLKVQVEACTTWKMLIKSHGQIIVGIKVIF